MSFNVVLLSIVIQFKKSSLKHTAHISGILLMTANAFFMSLLYIIVKILTKDFNFSSNQVGLLYKLTILIITSISCLKLGFIHHLKTTKLMFHALRGFFSIAGSLSMFYAVSILNVIDAAAISELTSAVMVIAGVLVFNEKLTSPKIILLLGSVLGVFFIKDFQNFGKNIDTGYIYAFFALISWSINNVIIKKLTKTEHSRAQLFYSSLFASIFALPIAFFNFSYEPINYSFDFTFRDWPPLSFTSTLIVLSAGIASLLHKISFFRAYKLSDISIVGPFDYLRLPFTGIFAFLVLGETIHDIYTWIGYGIIIASSMYFIMHRDAKNR